MPWLTTAPILIWAAIFIPLLVFFWYFHPGSRLNQILVWLAYTVSNFYFFMAVNWTAVNYYLRILPLVVSFILLLHWLKPLRNSPWLPERKPSSLTLLVGTLILIGLVCYVNYKVYQSTTLKESDTVPMLALYPVRTGMYTVINGGNGIEGWALNSYTTDWLGQPTEENDEMAYAVDIIEIRTSGAAADSILSKDFREYEIFNELVYSPCFGKVIYIEDGHPEVEPLSAGAGLGNHVIIQCADFLITLSNLRNGSINTEVGEEISFERQVALVGNTADFSVPSLHMHVTTLDGKPVPILFEAGYNFKFISRNHIYVR